MTCWVAQDERAYLSAEYAAYAEEIALQGVADDAADEYLLADGELLLHVADDTPRGHKLRSPAEAWDGQQLREGLTCEEILAACIWAPPGAALGHAMYVLRERLRTIAHDQHAEAVTAIARRMLKEQAE